MAAIILYGIVLFVLYVSGYTTALWIVLIGGALLLLAVLAGKTQQNKNETAGTNNPSDSAAANRPVKRIDKPHYIDLDEYQCPKCGARFRKNVTACPKCGVRFSGTETDEDEFIEEMVLWDDDD